MFFKKSKKCVLRQACPACKTGVNEKTPYKYINAVDMHTLKNSKRMLAYSVNSITGFEYCVTSDDGEDGTCIFICKPQTD